MCVLSSINWKITRDIQECGGITSVLWWITSVLWWIPPVLWRIFSTLEGKNKYFGCNNQSASGFPIKYCTSSTVLLVFLYSKEYSKILNTLHSTEHPLQYCWYPFTDSPLYGWYSNNTEHPLQCCVGVPHPQGYSLTRFNLQTWWFIFRWRFSTWEICCWARQKKLSSRSSSSFQKSSEWRKSRIIASSTFQHEKEQGLP